MAPVTLTKNFTLGALLLILLSARTLPAAAESGDANAPVDKTVDQVALELSNPVTTVRSIGNEIEFRSYQGFLPGAGSQDALVYRFEPSIPFQLGNGKNLLLRASVPINMREPEWRVNVGDPIFEVDLDYTEFLLRQSPQITADTGKFRNVHGHLSNITFDIAYGGESDSGFISMFGIASELPTSQNIAGSRNEFLLGPEIALGRTTEWGIFGAWWKQLLTVSGDDRYKTNETTLDLFFAYGLGNGWQITSNPTILYDWEADNGNELLLPLGGGVSKTLLLGRAPVKMELEIYNYVVSPDRFGPQWLLSFRVTPVIDSWFR